jgi:hypothetical protein
MKIESLIGEFYSDELKRVLMIENIVAPERDEFGEMQIFEFSNFGISIYVNLDNLIETIFLYLSQSPEHTSYKGPLPFSISQNDIPSTITEKLGPPILYGTSKTTNNSWIRYDFADYLMHLEFSSHNQAIVLITLMSPNILS